MTQTERENALDASPLLAGCRFGAGQLTDGAYPAGQMLGDRPHGVASVGLVVSGAVDVYSVALDGKDVQLNTLPPGECFGVSNLLTPEELETVLRCAVDTVVLYVPKAVLLERMERDAALTLRFAALCDRKLQFLLRRIELLTMQSCRGKLIAWLLSQKDERGRVTVHGSREDLARQLGASRAALFRELSALQALGALAVEGNTLTVLDQGLLEKRLYQPENTK